MYWKRLKVEDGPIHIAHIVWSFDVGGMENGIVNLINKSDPQRFKFSIISLTKLGNSQSRIIKPGIYCLALEKPPGNSLTLIRRLAAVFRKINPDLVHTHAWGTYFEGVAAALLGGVPTVIHGEHGTTYFEKRHRILAYRLLSRWTHRYTTVSMSLKQKLQDVVGLHAESIVCIPNGVELNIFQPAAASRKMVREHLGIGEHEFVVGSVGRLVSVKGYDLFIETICQLRDSGYSVRGVLVGDGPMREELESLASVDSSKEHIIFLGEQKNINDLLNAFDVFLSTSHSEGMSNTILEAMSTGLPILATDVGGTSELVLSDKSGVLVPSRSAATFSRAIIRLMAESDTKKAFGELGRVRAEKEFSINAMVERYHSLYWSCCQSRTGSIVSEEKPIK